jgi:uncharacterized membrane protein
MRKSLSLSKCLLAAGLAIALAAAWPACGLTAEAKVENYTNDAVYVATGYNYGQMVSGGWTAIGPNQSQTFTAPDNAELCLRIEDKNGKSITFGNFQTIRTFPVSNDRFTVNNEPDDATVRTLKWGNQLEKSYQMKKNDPLPAGWENREFFRIGTGNHKLEIKP